MKIIVDNKKIRERITPLTTFGSRYSPVVFSFNADDNKTLAVLTKKNYYSICISDLCISDNHIIGIYDTLEEAEQEIQNIITAFESGKTVYRVK